MIGAYFPCFRELTAANEILIAYRKYFPNTTVVMVNDAGDETHSVLGKKYNCKYFHETENIGYPGGRQHHEQIIRWIKRFLNYIQLIDDEWFFLLEDDVFIMNHVNENTLQYDINGVNPDNLLPWPSVNIIKERGYHKDTSSLVYGAMGGAIFRTSFFKKMALRIEDVERDLNLFGETCPQYITGQNWYYSDVVLSYLTYLYGGNLGMYPEFAELWFSDLNSRLTNNQVGCLNQYKFLYKYLPHPYLTISQSDKYTIVLPTRGSGSAFELFVEHLLLRYVTFLDPSEIAEFIVICPEINFELAKSKILEYGGSLPFTFYTDENIAEISTNNWMKQQIIKLAICSRIKTDHYFIIDDDLIITKPLKFCDFFDEQNNIYYSYETTWPINGPNFATNTNWWISSLNMSGLQPNKLLDSKNLMGVTPQLMVTRIVHQMLQSLGADWMVKMDVSRSTEYCLYWIYLIKTLRTHYYVPSSKFFAMDNNTNILIQGLTKNEIIEKLHKGLTDKQYTFLVAQSWINYPKEWLIEAIL
jgi:hypothetical protein